MGKPLVVTDDLLKSIESLAYAGLNQEEIAQSLNRCKETLFLNNADKGLLSAYNEGKKANKLKLLNDIEQLGDESQSDEVKFKSKKYLLAVKHKLSETIKAEITGKDGQSLYPSTITIQGVSNTEPVEPEKLGTDGKPLVLEAFKGNLSPDVIDTEPETGKTHSYDSYGEPQGILSISGVTKTDD